MRNSSDQIGRRILIAAGMAFQGVGLTLLAFATNLFLANSAAVILGVGTAMVYPTLIASVADRVPTQQRATALGIYRFFRDGGYALGAAIAGAGLIAPTPTVLVIGVVFLLLVIPAWQLRRFNL